MKIINAKDLSGSLYTVEVNNGVFGSIIKQDQALPAGADQVDAKQRLMVPGMVDIHVHSRDPGFTHKEDWGSLAAAAFKGGVTCVCDMPNTMPNTMDRASIEAKKEIASSSPIDFWFYLGVGAGNIDQIKDLLLDESLPLCGLKVYYGQSTGELMYDDLDRLAEALPQPFPRLLSFHSEDQCSIDRNASMMQPQKCPTPDSFKVHSDIRSSMAAHKSTQTILDWAHKQGLAVHIAHLSTPAEVELIQHARSRGQVVTSEVAPHHLVFSTNDYERLGSRIKMNPPVRSEGEREQLCRQFGEGLIHAFATDHAPHTIEEKSETEYTKCPSGVPSVEWFTPLLLTLGKRYGLSLEQAVDMGSASAYKLIGIEDRGRIAEGFSADFVLLEEGKFEITEANIASKCGWTPFDGMEVDYRVSETWHKGVRVYAYSQ